MRFVISLILQILLFPLTLLLASVIYTRNWFYNIGILQSTRPSVFTINVGNLNLGGTGKTPHVEYLVKLLADKYQMSILSRGYKRETKGFVLADDNATAKTIGDEPMQYYQKFKDKIKVIVCENRVAGVDKIQADFPKNELIVLDDAFQHRRIAPHLNLLLFDYNRPFYTDHLAPVGKLRDIRPSAKRADAVIVSKCPEHIPASNILAMKENISRYTLPDVPVFFSRIQYKPIVSYANGQAFALQNTATVLTAIAKPEVFIDYLTAKGYKIDKIIDYPDHFAFSRKEIEAVLNQSGTLPQIITTEKDMVKIKPLLQAQELKCFFYVPIEIHIFDKHEFDNFVLKAISKSI